MHQSTWLEFVQQSKIHIEPV